jgi:hypothetical protein
MPFGKKPGSIGSTIDFDSIYQDLIVPAIKEAELEVIFSAISLDIDVY